MSAYHPHEQKNFRPYISGWYKSHPIKSAGLTEKNQQIKSNHTISDTCSEVKEYDGINHSATCTTSSLC